MNVTFIGLRAVRSFLSVLVRSGLFFIGPGPVFGLFHILKNNQKIRNFGGKWPKIRKIAEK